MDNIIEIDPHFDFSKIYLANPTNLTGGAYFTKLLHNNKPLYIQTPKCLTKQGFIKNNSKRMYTDLMFNNNDSIFINWIENLELKCQNLIYEKGDNWFENKLQLEDIESAFTPCIKVFKSGKFYLIRVNIKDNIKIFNEQNHSLLQCDINSETNIISILEVKGIKFTTRNFQLDFEMKQTMVVSPDPFLEDCFIKNPHIKASQSEKYSNISSTSSLFKSYSHIPNLNNINTQIYNDDIDNGFENKMEALNTTDNMSNTDVDNGNIDNENLNSLHDTLHSLQKYEENDNDEESKLEETKLEETKLEEAKLEETKLEETKLEETKLEDKDSEKNNIQKVNLNDELEEFNLEINNHSLETIQLKKPNQVYYDLYMKSKKKAKEAKQKAILAYLEVKNIKKMYNLNDLEDEDENDSDNQSDFNIDLEDLNDDSDNEDE
jgi:uncharacterized protein YjbI with pentapeptide repeats